MTERVRQFAHRRPRIFIVVVLCVCILASGVSYALYTILSKPEFPSEHTPLSLVPEGIKWTGDNAALVQYHYGAPWISFSNGSSSWDALNASQLLNTGRSATVNLGTRTAGNLTLSLNLTDITGDGAFGQEDYFVISVVNGSGFVEEVTYMLTVTWRGGPNSYWTSYDFVIDEGVLYAWSTGPKYFL